MMCAENRRKVPCVMLRLTQLRTWNIGVMPVPPASIPKALTWLG